MKLRILLADDHQMFREAIRILLEREPHLEVVAETGDGLEVLRLVRETSPQIVCLDIEMPGLNGIEIMRRLSGCCPQVKVIGLSIFSDPRYVLDMMNAGASAYVTKAAAGAELLRAIDAVSRGQAYFCPDATNAIKDAVTSRAEPAGAKLGNRERQVLKLVAEGHTSAQIAERLGIVSATVEVHRRNIMRKLNMHNVAELTRYAIRNGLVSSS